MSENKLEKDGRDRKKQTKDEQLDMGKGRDKWRQSIRALCTTGHEDDR
jgi:hypothetical protein